jgi:hypothetical protein
MKTIACRSTTGRRKAGYGHGQWEWEWELDLGRKKGIQSIQHLFSDITNFRIILFICSTPYSEIETRFR